MRRNHLDCQHRLDLVVRPNYANRREYSVDVLLAWWMTGGAITSRIDEAIEQNGLVTSAAGLPSLTYSRTIRDDQNQL